MKYSLTLVADLLFCGAASKLALGFSKCGQSAAMLIEQKEQIAVQAVQHLMYGIVLSPTNQQSLRGQKTRPNALAGL